MHVISKRALRDFWEIHPPARKALAVWYRLMERWNYANFHSLRRTFGAADYVAPYTIFDVGGNKYRVVTSIHYDRKRVYILHVFTHEQYDTWSGRIRRKGTGK